MSQEHYFSSEPTTKKAETQISFDVAGKNFIMAGASGTFSATKLDPGTKVLLPNSTGSKGLPLANKAVPLLH